MIPSAGAGLFQRTFGPRPVAVKLLSAALHGSLAGIGRPDGVDRRRGRDVGAGPQVLRRTADIEEGLDPGPGRAARNRRGGGASSGCETDRPPQEGFRKGSGLRSSGRISLRWLWTVSALNGLPMNRAPLGMSPSAGLSRPDAMTIAT